MMDGCATAMTVGVRAFCAFVAKTGDLDLRFTPAPSAEEGIAGHQAVAARRGPDYQREVAAEGSIGGLHLRGRIDGLVPQPLALEEIKTFRGDLARVPANHRLLHWAQLKTYGALYCAANDLESIALRMVYFDVDARQEYEETIHVQAEELLDFVATHAERYLAWAAEQHTHRLQRDAALQAMAFPHDTVHAGQQQLMDEVRDAIAEGRHLLAQAPTGVGKTVGTLFPALKALGSGTIDRIFYLTAKTSARLEATKALRSLRGAGDAIIPLRVLELTAREKACEHKDKACHGESCPLARGFYDRLPAARAEAQHQRLLSPDRLRQVALSHQVCPYYLGQEMVRWSDVVVGDVNYYFDQSALLHGMTQFNGWRVAVLADEAHNLIGRARAMYSATVSQAMLRVVSESVPGALRPVLARLDRAFSDLADIGEETGTPPEEPPRAFAEVLGRTVSRLGEHLAEDPTRNDAGLLQLYFDLLAFQRLTEEFGAHALCELESSAVQAGLFDEPLSTLSIRNVVPAPHLQPRIRAAHSVVAFSATLSPADFYRRMLGFPDDTLCCDAPSPFRREQLRVRIVPGISTALSRRRASAAPIAGLIARQFASRPGNYLAFFSSFAYLELVAAAFAAQHPQIDFRCQSSGMSEMQRQQFLDAFTAHSRTVGFAVLGGAFGEGIDLPGKRLIGAFIATLGQPQHDAHNQRMAARIDEIFGDGNGYRYTFLYPGLQKVVQAAGRVIRSSTDQGIVFLVDPRYRDATVRQVLPAQWRSEAD